MKFSTRVIAVGCFILGIAKLSEGQLDGLIGVGISIAIAVLSMYSEKGKRG